MRAARVGTVVTDGHRAIGAGDRPPAVVADIRNRLAVVLKSAEAGPRDEVQRVVQGSNLPERRQRITLLDGTGSGARPGIERPGKATAQRGKAVFVPLDT